MKSSNRLLLFFCFPALIAHSAFAGDWPQLQHNPQRTGYTPDTVKPPFKVAWHREFPPERVQREVQAIVYSGKVFVGTKSGNLYALDAKTGKDSWVYKAGGAIVHSAACGDGKAVVACMDGTVRAVDAETGAEQWIFRGDEWFGFYGAPLIAEGNVFAGQRQGVFYALDLKTGALKWTFEPGAPIFGTAAYNNGRVYFCDENLFVHCLNAADGAPVWKSDKLYGQSAKQVHPVVYNGFVVMRPMMTHPQNDFILKYGYGRDPADNLLNIFQPTWAQFHYWYGNTNTPPPPDVQTPLSHWIMDIMPEVKAGRIPPIIKEAVKLQAQHFVEKPWDQDLFILEEATGRQSFIAPHYATLSLPGPVAPPPADNRGAIIIPWVFLTQCWARLDLEKQDIVEIITPAHGPQNGDNNSGFSVAGNLFFNAHMCGGHHYHGCYDLDAKKFYPLPRQPKYWNELSDACESGANAASIADGFVYHINFHQLAAWTSAEGENK